MGNKTVFPENFLWGAATSAYQIEGAPREGGKGKSIWDRFAHTRGKIADGTTGDVACDHYHRWPEDIRIMKELGLKAYRFSVAWTRVLPEGKGKINQKGLDFYGKLVDALLEAGIIPFVTLYHWDLPQALEDAGGWVSRDTAKYFADYAGAVSKALGDRVKHWITQNEPSVVMSSGYHNGVHAPGIKDLSIALPVSHHLLLSHGLAVPIIRKNSRNSEVGLSLAIIPAENLSSDDVKDSEAARSFDGYFNRWFLDPLYGREYPHDKVEEYKKGGYLTKTGLVFVKPGDYKIISSKCDFLGINYYMRMLLRYIKNVPGFNWETVKPEKSRYTDMGWEIYPEGIYNALTRVYKDYAPSKLYVTENGVSFSDKPDRSGTVKDARRIDYLEKHFAYAERAVKNGVPLRGYFVWSLLDNFEWDRGLSQRFGIVWVNYKTGQRIIKDSGYWYKTKIAGAY